MDDPRMTPEQQSSDGPVEGAGDGATEQAEAQAGDVNTRREADGARAAEGDREPWAKAVAPADDAGSGRGAEVYERRAALPVAGDAPDSLTEMMQPAAPATGRTEEGPRISTVLGPLPERATVQQTRDLNDAVHGILVIGLVISTALLLLGLGLAIVAGEGLPTATLPLQEALAGALQLQPEALLSLGLIALMFTPIVRVIGSVVVFLWERDWLYAAITFTVLVVMGVSVVVGHG